MTTASRFPASLLLPIALVVSGAAGLIDQLVWFRRAALVFGATAPALSTVLMVFFLGLALGAAIAGRLTSRLARPLRAAALVEIGLAAMVLITLPEFGLANQLFGKAYRSLGSDSTGLVLVRAGLVAAVILPPTLLMGATLPLVARGWVRDVRRVGGSIATLYATNTIGGVAGVLLAGFVLLPRIGAFASLGIAATLNLGAALLFRIADRSATAPPLDVPSAAPLPSPRTCNAAAIGALAFGSGFVALGLELLWSRFLVLIVHNSVTSVALALAIVLAGIAMGSALAARFADRLQARALVFGLSQVVGALLVLALTHLPPVWWQGLGGEIPTACILLLPPAVLSGAAFPLAVRMATGETENAGSTLGRLLSLNTLGGILGAGVAGFVLLPAGGMEISVRVLTFLGLATGACAWFTLDRARSFALRVGFTVLAAGIWSLVLFLSPARLPIGFLAPADRLIAFREGIEANLAVVRGSRGERTLEMDRWWQGQDTKTHQIMAAHLPMLLHPDPHSVLVVGVGAGQTPARFLLYPIQRLDAVDIEPRIPELLTSHFPSAWLADPRTRFLKLDGRNHLAHAAERYDVISLELGQLFRPGIAGFYTTDFYRDVRERLAPGGVVSQFVALSFMTPEIFRGVVRSFLAVFPQATLWYNTSELLLVAGRDEVPRLSSARLAWALRDSSIASDLSWSHWGGPGDYLTNPEVISAMFLAGPQALASLAGQGPVYRDDPPRLAFAARNLSADTDRERMLAPLVAAHLDSIATFRPGVNVAQELSRLNARRALNLGDLIAATHLRDLESAQSRGDIAGAAEMARLASAANPGNLVARRLMGDAALMLGRPDDAEDAYGHALAIAPADARSHAGIGYLRLQAGRLVEAIEHLRLALANGPDDAELRHNLGAALARTGDYRGALAEFERAIQLRPDDTVARANAEKVRAALGPAPSPGPAHRD